MTAIGQPCLWGQRGLPFVRKFNKKRLERKGDWSGDLFTVTRFCHSARPTQRQRALLHAARRIGINRLCLRNLRRSLQ